MPTYDANAVSTEVELIPILAILSYNKPRSPAICASLVINSSCLALILLARTVTLTPLVFASVVSPAFAVPLLKNAVAALYL